jgi:hypothetical protein
MLSSGAAGTIGGELIRIAAVDAAQSGDGIGADAAGGDFTLGGLYRLLV